MSVDNEKEKFTRVNCSNTPITGFNGTPLVPINIDDLPGRGYIPETINEEINEDAQSTGTDNRHTLESDHRSY